MILHLMNCCFPFAIREGVVPGGGSVCIKMASNGFSNGLSSDERVLETIFNPEHPIVGMFEYLMFYYDSKYQITNLDCFFNYYTTHRAMY